MTAPTAAVGDRAPVVSRPERQVVFRHRAQYAMLRATIGAIGTLGFRRASDFGARVGAWGYSPLKIRRRVVEKQIAAAFPEWSTQRVQEVARASYEHLGRTTIEAAVLPRYDDRMVLELVDDPPEWHLIERALSLGRGVMLVAGHLGNWELAGNYLAARGLRMHAVARQMENPLFDGYLNRTRRRLGVEAIWDGDAVRRVPRALRENGAVALLIDQGAVGLASTWVPFFGRMAKTPRGPGVFALRLQTPVIFVAPLRKPDGRFALGLEEISVAESGDRNADVDRIVAGYTAALERWVRRAPEQYFWHHRRWKHQLPNTPPELGDPLK
jgi:KDO2-lipid IV(A) lauroyltransferase